jgi:hypothetical protein
MCLVCKCVHLLLNFAALVDARFQRGYGWAGLTSNASRRSALLLLLIFERFLLYTPHIWGSAAAPFSLRGDSLGWVQGRLILRNQSYGILFFGWACLEGGCSLPALIVGNVVL